MDRHDVESIRAKLQERDPEWVADHWELWLETLASLDATLAKLDEAQEKCSAQNRLHKLKEARWETELAESHEDWKHVAHLKTETIKELQSEIAVLKAMIGRSEELG